MDAEGPERTPDGRYLVIAGRRWRASDPALPDELRTELVAELMSARRAVRSDAGSARPRVHDAKIALGERGEPWWEPPSDEGWAARRAAAARALARHRGVEPADCDLDAGRIVGDASWGNSTVRHALDPE